MKRNNFTQFIAIMLLISLISCEKGNLYYESYENNIQQFDGTTYDYLNKNRVIFDSLLLVLDRVYPLQDSINKDEVTLFAVTNRSFEIALQNSNTKRKVNNLPPQYLDDISLNDLDSIMCRYIIKSNIDTDYLKPLKDGEFMKAIKYNYMMHLQYKKLNASGYVQGGQQQILFTDPNSSIFSRYWETTSTNSVNVKTTNGIIHILSPTHNFGFNKLGNLNK